MINCKKTQSETGGTYSHLTFICLSLSSRFDQNNQVKIRITPWSCENSFCTEFVVKSLGCAKWGSNRYNYSWTSKKPFNTARVSLFKILVYLFSRLLEMRVNEYFDNYFFTSSLHFIKTKIFPFDWFKIFARSAWVATLHWRF